MKTQKHLFVAIVPVVAVLLFICGCGGGGGSSDSTALTMITGTVTAGPVDGASLSVLGSQGGEVTGPVTVTAGVYSVEVPDADLAGDLVFESAGGACTDEGTGQAGVSPGTLSAYVPGGTLSAGSTVHLGAGSTVIREIVRGGVTFDEASSLFAETFGVGADSSKKIADAMAPGPDATQEELLTGLRNAAFSQLTMDLGLAPGEQGALLAAMGQDLVDGKLDGTAGGAPVAVNGTLLMDDTQNRYERAIVNFRSGGNDATGLTPTQIGPFPFAKVAYTGSYRIEYLSSMGGMAMAGPMEGKTTFTLAVSDAATGAPVPGLELSVMPWMSMDMHTHSTPVDVVTDNGDGTYTCTVYYLMASTMASGMSMGYWELRVMAGGETAYFYPSVMMAMTETKKAVLKDAEDKIAGMMGNPPSVRSYYLFNDGLKGSTGNHAWSLFVATRQSMMNHPAVSVGTGLADENGTPWTVDTMTLEVSEDDGATWKPLTDEGGGHWTISGLRRMTSGICATLYVRMNVNGADKTADGSPSGAAATFEVTVP